MAESYGIMRTEKRKRSAVRGIENENNRSRERYEKTGHDFPNSDIDWNKTDDNMVLKQTHGWNRYITSTLKELGIKPRSNSVVLLDTLYTASPEWFETHSNEEIIAYFQDCLKFHEQEFGEAFNATIHFDEETPHLHVASIPLVEDEKGMHLSAKIVMGNKRDYRLRQDRFYEQVAKKYGMARGEIREPSETKKHTTKREWQEATQMERIKENESILQKQEAELAEKKSEVKSLDDQIAKKREQLDLSKVVSELYEKLTKEYDRLKKKMALKMHERKAANEYITELGGTPEELDKRIQRHADEILADLKGFRESKEFKKSFGNSGLSRGNGRSI